MVPRNWGDLQEFHCCCCCILHQDQWQHCFCRSFHSISSGPAVKPMTCSVLVLQPITALWEGFFPTTELSCVCQLRLLPVPHCSHPLPTHRAFTLLDKKRWRANVSQTAPEHLGVLSSQMASERAVQGPMVGRDSWAPGQLWPLVCLTTSREDSERAVVSL